MHKDMVRLNTLIAKNEELSKRLAESSFNLEKDFVAELKVRWLGWRTGRGGAGLCDSWCRAHVSLG